MGIILAVSGLVMNYYVLTSCFFQRITEVNPLNGEAIAGSERGYGFLAREADFGVQPDYQQCIYYPDEEYNELFHDGYMPAGKFFAIFSAALGSVGLCVLLLTCCLAFSPVMFERWLLWGYLLAACSMAFSMFIFGSQFCADNKCKIGQGGGYAISNFLFWCVMANTVKSMGEAPPPRGPRGSGGDDQNFEDDENYDLDDETGQDMFYETQEAMYPRRARPVYQYNAGGYDVPGDESDGEDAEKGRYGDGNDEDADEEDYDLPSDDNNYSIDDDDDDDDYLGGNDPRVGYDDGPTIT